MEPKPLWF